MDQASWNALVQKYVPPFGAFLQSWEWGEFQMALGFEVIRIQEEVKGKLVLAQAVQFPLPFKSSYWHIPKGPLGDAQPKVAIDFLKKTLPGGAFLKLEPVTKPRGGNRAKDRQPAVTTIVDLTQSEAQLAENMKAKTRYNIRLAEKKGVTSR
ncbi:MAG: hypothetical protein QG626_680, partial [Patescibacteria group bacterium]|nr:hypothetical protein [Patescibacteria group bacterium]